MQLDQQMLALSDPPPPKFDARPDSASRLTARVQRVCCVSVAVGGERMCRGGRAGGLVEGSKVALGGLR